MCSCSSTPFAFTICLVWSFTNEKFPHIFNLKRQKSTNGRNYVLPHMIRTSDRKCVICYPSYVLLHKIISLGLPQALKEALIKKWRNVKSSKSRITWVIVEKRHGTKVTSWEIRHALITTRSQHRRTESAVKVRNISKGWEGVWGGAKKASNEIFREKGGSDQ